MDRRSRRLRDAAPAHHRADAPSDLQFHLGGHRREAHIHIHSAVHLGFGVAPRGLLVPVVKDAQDMTTRELAATVSRLIDEAQGGTLKPTELQGSTFTVSNFGALGLDEGVPIINYPEAAILGMGSLKSRPRRRRRCRRGPPDNDPDLRV